MSGQDEHVILVAFTVIADDFEAAQRDLMDVLPQPQAPWNRGLTSWWIAEDERYDRSDNDSAVFVPMGTQSDRAGLETYYRYLIADEIRQYAQDRLIETEGPNLSEDITAALRAVAAKVERGA